MRYSPLLAVLVPAVLACRDATDPAAGLAVRATADRVEAPAGERIWVDVTVANETGRPIQIPGGFIAVLEVRDATGRVVAYGRYQLFLAIAYPPRWLAPGETVTDRAPWAGEVNGDVTDGARAAPGTYEVRAVVPVMRPRTAVYSAPITVVLTPS